MLLFPKTGTTFVRQAIRNIHEKRLSGSILLRAKNKLAWSGSDFEVIKTRNGNGLSVHGSVRNIPRDQLNKEIISITRSPFSRILSMFFYQSWLRNPGKYGQKARIHFENYPNLSLEDFIRYKQLILRYKFEWDTEISHIIEKWDIGPLTIQFIEFYFLHPEKTLKKLSDDYIRSKAYLKDMAQVKFLRQENLLDDLCGLLTSKNYSENELNLIRAHERKNVSQVDPAKSASLWTQKSYDSFRYSERYLFNILKEIGFDYDQEIVGIRKPKQL